MKNTPVKTKHIAFDLDDTLLDTFRLLIPPASREACAAMIQEGLKTDIQGCLAAREQFMRTTARSNLYQHLVGVFGVRDKAIAEVVAKKGYEAFYHRKIEESLALFPGARDLLKDLRSRYGLHLVTAGSPDTQKSKVKHLNLEPHFDSIHFVDPTQGQRKRDAFQKVMASSSCLANEHLSVGNRLDTDIADAKELGWTTCYMRYGEYINLSPISAFETPDFQISDIKELISTCRL